MKKIIGTLSFAMSFLMIQSCSNHQEDALASMDLKPSSACYAGGIAADTLPKKQSKTTKKKETAPTKHADTTRYGVDKSSTVTGEAGSGSGVGNGGSKSAADTMTIIK